MITTEDRNKYKNLELIYIEDYYDNGGNYIKTVFVDSKLEKSMVTLVEKFDDTIVELQGPLTILIPDNRISFNLNKMNRKEKRKVKEHILSFREM